MTFIILFSNGPTKSKAFDFVDVFKSSEQVTSVRLTGLIHSFHQNVPHSVDRQSRKLSTLLVVSFLNISIILISAN
jgi:hypothetical protein